MIIPDKPRKTSRGVVDMPRFLMTPDQRTAYEPPPILQSQPPQSHAKGITDELAKRKNRAWDAFKVWLLQRSASEIEAADSNHLSRVYAPLEGREIAQVLKVRIAAIRRARLKP